MWYFGLEKQKYNVQCLWRVVENKTNPLSLKSGLQVIELDDKFTFSKMGVRHIFTTMMQSFWRNWKGVDADIITKPANSPDTNLLDLGFFYAVQSANDEVTGGEGEMIQHIQPTFTHYLRQKINQTGLTYISCLK